MTNVIAVPLTRLHEVKEKYELDDTQEAMEPSKDCADQCDKMMIESPDIYNCNACPRVMMLVRQAGI